MHACEPHLSAANHAAPTKLTRTNFDAWIVIEGKEHAAAAGLEIDSFWTGKPDYGREFAPLQKSSE